MRNKLPDISYKIYNSSRNGKRKARFNSSSMSSDKAPSAKDTCATQPTIAVNPTQGACLYTQQCNTDIVTYLENTETEIINDVFIESNKEECAAAEAWCTPLESFPISRGESRENMHTVSEHVCGTDDAINGTCQCTLRGLLNINSEIDTLLHCTFGDYNSESILTSQHFGQDLDSNWDDIIVLENQFTENDGKHSDWGDCVDTTNVKERLQNKIKVEREREATDGDNDVPCQKEANVDDPMEKRKSLNRLSAKNSRSRKNNEICNIKQMHTLLNRVNVELLNSVEELYSKINVLDDYLNEYAQPQCRTPSKRNNNLDMKSDSAKKKRNCWPKT